MKKFAVIGKTLAHSFSPAYFAGKFRRLGLEIGNDYRAIELANVDALKAFLKESDLDGFNVTIPYKEEILTLLDKVDPVAQKIGSVNCVDRTSQGWKGYNTDHIGFSQTLRPMLKRSGCRALVLGSGGASRAVRYSLEQLNIPYAVVSRDERKGDLTYKDLTNGLISEHKLIVNSTPLGTWPVVDESPDIPYSALSNDHILYDLVYNPRVSLFLKEGLKRGCAVRNGWRMLQIQADKSWEIWNRS